MTDNTISPEERRLIIIRGIQHDHTNIEIAAEMGVAKWTILKDLRLMTHNRDPELRQAYADKEARLTAKMDSVRAVRDDKFHHMTGKTFQEKNFENMIDYYRAELQVIFKSRDEVSAIGRLDTCIRKTLKRNEILTGHRGRSQLTDKARAYLRHN